MNADRVRVNSLCGLGNFDDGQRVSGPERFSRDSLPGGPSLESGTGVTVMVMTTAITVTAATAVAVHQ